jgi:transposase
MLLKTLLNRVHPVKGFVYASDTLVADALASNGVRIEARLRARRRSKGICSQCGVSGPTYDHLPARRFDFVPLWGITVVLLYALRRINCPRCGVKVERVPWCPPSCKSPMTTALMLFLSRWARLLSWQQVSVAFDVSWESVYRAVEQVVDYGLTHRNLTGIGAIGVDGKAKGSGKIKGVGRAL